MVSLDIARSEADYAQCRELLTRTHPADTMPKFGSQTGVTFIVFDSADRTKVLGCIHGDLVPEIKSMAVDPEYRYQEASFALLHQFMEGHFRVAGYSAVTHTVPNDKVKTLKMLKKSGALEIGQNDTRLLKEL